MATDLDQFCNPISVLYYSFFILRQLCRYYGGSSQVSLYVVNTVLPLQQKTNHFLVCLDYLLLHYSTKFNVTPIRSLVLLQCLPFSFLVCRHSAEQILPQLVNEENPVFVCHKTITHLLLFLISKLSCLVSPGHTRSNRPFETLTAILLAVVRH